MKIFRSLQLFTIIAINVLVLVLAPAVFAENPAPLRVGIVLSIGGLGDRSFNDATYAGVQLIRKIPGCSVEVIEPADGSAIEPALEFLVSSGFDLVTGVGVFAAEPVRRVAERHPRKTFILLDSVVDLPNVQSILFNEEEGSFFAGAFAGLLTKSGKIGFLGGMDSPVIRTFERGFARGAAFVKPEVKVLSRYAGPTPEAFNQPDLGRKLGLEMAAEQADFIYHAAGATGNGLIEAARFGDFLVIGVDTDQSAIVPGKVAASMVKRLDIALDRAVRAFSAGKLKCGVLTLGLADGGVELAISRFNKNLVTPVIRDRLKEVETFLLHQIANQPGK